MEVSYNAFSTIDNPRSTEQNNDPFSATVGGRLLQRDYDESAEAFLARVEAEAKLAAKPGCNAVAVVWPRPEVSPGDLK